MKRTTEKIKKIKESRINPEDKYLLQYLTNLSEEWSGDIVSYKQNDIKIFEFSINTYCLYMSYEIYKKYFNLLNNRVDKIYEIDVPNLILELIKTNLTIKSIKNKIPKEVEECLFEDGKITYNPLFNSITGKVQNIKSFYPILVW